METMSLILTTLAEMAIKSLCLTLFALFFLYLIRGAAPTLRHRATLWAFILLTLLPLCTTLPGLLRLPILPSGSFIAEPTILVPGPLAPGPLPTAPTPPPPPLPADVLVGPQTAPTPPPPVGMVYATPSPSFSWPMAIMGVWAGITAISLCSLFAGLIGLSGLRRASRPADAVLREIAAEAAWTMDISAPALRFSDAIGVPIAFGIQRPAILLPVAAASWESERLQAALLHESAHIARSDFSMQLFARIVCALYAWNPLVWRLFSILRAEAEADCDARVVAAGIAAPDYADHLFAIAQQSGRQPYSINVTPAMARPSRPDTLETRLRRLLKPSRVASRRQIALVAALAAPLILTALTLRPVAQARDAAPQPTAPIEAVPLPVAAEPPPPVKFLSPAPALDAKAFPALDARGFLKWSMDHYAAARTFRAEWTWELEFPGLSPASSKKAGPNDIRSIVYDAPNRFHITATKYRQLTHEFICDGKKLVVLKKGYNQAPEFFEAPASLATATDNVFLNFSLGHPHFGGSSLYAFLGGSAGLNHLLDLDTVEKRRALYLSRPQDAKNRKWLQDLAVYQKRLEGVPIHFGPDVIIGSEPCKTVIFNGGGELTDERRAAISVRDGFVRQLVYIQRAQKLPPAVKAAQIKKRDQEINSPDFKKLTAAQQKETIASLNYRAEYAPEAITTEIFTKIVTNEPIEDSAFDTTIANPSQRMDAKGHGKPESDSARPR